MFAQFPSAARIQKDCINLHRLISDLRMRNTDYFDTFETLHKTDRETKNAKKEALQREFEHRLAQIFKP